MKVYAIACWYPYEGCWRPEYVFSTREKAEAAQAILAVKKESPRSLGPMFGRVDIVEIELDTMP